MKRSLAWILMVSQLLLLGCALTPGAEPPDEEPAAPGETAAQPEADRPLTGESKADQPAPPHTPVTPLPGVREGRPGEDDPPERLPQEEQFSRWHQADDAPAGHAFIFSLPFDSVEISVQTGRISQLNESDGQTLKLSHDASAGQPATVYWQPDDTGSGDHLSLAILNPLGQAVSRTDIVIQQQSGHDANSPGYLARMNDSSLVMYDAPIGRGTVISTVQVSRGIGLALSQIAPTQRQTLTAMPLVEAFTSESANQADLPVTIPYGIQVYRLSFPSQSYDYVVYYDATNHGLLEQLQYE